MARDPWVMLVIVVLLGIAFWQLFAHLSR